MNLTILIYYFYWLFTFYIKRHNHYDSMNEISFLLYFFLLIKVCKVWNLIFSYTEILYFHILEKYKFLYFKHLLTTKCFYLFLQWHLNYWILWHLKLLVYFKLIYIHVVLVISVGIKLVIECCNKSWKQLHVILDIFCCFQSIVWFIMNYILFYLLKKV